MKKLYTVPVIVCALGCLLLSGCQNKDVDKKELYYDSTQDPGRMAAAGYSDIFTVECCVIFRASFLKPYVGWDIVEMKLFNPADNDTISYTPGIYEAAAGASSPGDLVSRNASPAEIDAETWQTITLDTPVTIEASRDYWAGYSVVTIPGIFLLAEGAKLNYGNNRIAFYGNSDYQKSRSNWLVRIIVKRK